MLENHHFSLVLTLAAGVVIVAGFNNHVAVAQDESLRRRFVELAGISLGVAGLSYVIGFLVRNGLGV